MYLSRDFSDNRKNKNGFFPGKSAREARRKCFGGILVENPGFSLGKIFLKGIIFFMYLALNLADNRKTIFERIFIILFPHVPPVKVDDKRKFLL